jgi:TolB-like protein/Flp pilus assembly protein TadD
VPDVRRARASVPEGTEQALRKALSPVPADRFTSAADFARALAAPAATARAPATVTTTLAESVGPAVTAPTLRVAAVPPTSAEPTRPAAPGRRLPFAALTLGLGILIGLGVLFAWRRTHTPGGEAPGPKRLAVLPFENLGDPADAYFADGITDEVRGKLAQVSGLAVIARASSNEYRRTAKPPQQIARELGADYLLTATVRWEKAPGGQSRVRVSPELVRVEPGAAPTTKWQRPFDAQLTDVFQVQADIATKVASALDAALGDSARRELAARPTTSLPAYDAFLRGEEVSAGLATADLPTLRRAVGYYAEAVALDSAFAPAWAQLGRAHALLYNNGIPAPADAEQARRAAERAVALAPARPEGHLALGVYYLLVRSDPSRALAELAVGRRAAPNNADLLTVSAIAEEALGRWDAGLAHLRQAAVLDPRAVLTARRLARTLLWLRRYPEAMRESDRALALAPASLGALEDRAMMRLAQGDLAGARAVLRAAIKEVEPAALVANLANYWDLYWVLDDEQQRLLLRLRPGAFDDNRAVWGLCLAETYALRGGLARARAYADSARAAFEAQLRATPGDAQAHVLHGVALAYLGRNAEAVREGERGLALSPITKDAYNGAYFQHQLARIYLLVGEPEKALDRLEPLLTIPYYLTPSWLKIDPTFAPLRGNPRYERLVASK